jgi:hypothetical protein
MRGEVRKTLLATLDVACVLFAALIFSACGPLTSLTKLALPSSTLTLTPPTVEQSETAPATATAAASVTRTAEPTVTPTATTTTRAVSAASRVKATPTSTPPAGIFVSAIKIDPTPARSNDFPQFTVTFLNTTGQPQTYRWFIKVYMPDQPQSFGETSKIESVLAPKTSAVRAFSDWKTTVVLNCLFFIGRVFWVDENNQVHEFLKSNATSPATGFYVCP